MSDNSRDTTTHRRDLRLLIVEGPEGRTHTHTLRLALDGVPGLVVDVMAEGDPVPPGPPPNYLVYVSPRAPALPLGGEGLTFALGITDPRKGVLATTLEDVIHVLSQEFKPVSAVTPQWMGDEHDLEKLSLRDVRLIAARCMREVEFESFLLDAGIPRTSELTQGPLMSRLVHLIHFVREYSTVSKLVVWLRLECGGCVDYQIRELQAEEVWTFQGHTLTPDAGGG